VHFLVDGDRARAIRQHDWDPTLPTTAGFFAGDTPRRPPRLSRRLSEHVMAQVNEHLEPEHPGIFVELGADGARRSLVLTADGNKDLFPMVQEVAADVLYAAGDPLSAASLWESAMKQLGATRVAPRLVAAYAALNRGGDARRVAALVPNEPLADLALAWSELAANGGDREHGALLAGELMRDVEQSANATIAAMTGAVAAIADAQRGDRAAMQAKLEAMRRATPTQSDAAFLGYLAGIALRDVGDIDESRREFSAAVERSPDSIGGALARRERANLPT